MKKIISSVVLVFAALVATGCSTPQPDEAPVSQPAVASPADRKEATEAAFLKELKCDSTRPRDEWLTSPGEDSLYKGAIWCDYKDGSSVQAVLVSDHDQALQLKREFRDRSDNPWTTDGAWVVGATDHEALAKADAAYRAALR